MKNKNSNLNDWKVIKDKHFGKVGTERRDQLDREVRALKIGLMLRQARESKNMTQEDLAKVIEKKRTYISRVENDGSNMTLKTLLEIVERGLGGKVTIGIEILRNANAKQKQLPLV